MDRLINIAASSRFFKSDIGYHLIRASTVIIFVLFGYQKWFATCHKDQVHESL